MSLLKPNAIQLFLWEMFRKTLYPIFLSFLHHFRSKKLHVSQSQHVRFNLIPEIGVGYLKNSGMQNLYIRITFSKTIQTIVTDDICLVTFLSYQLIQFLQSLYKIYSLVAYWL